MVIRSTGPTIRLVKTPAPNAEIKDSASDSGVHWFGLEESIIWWKKPLKQNCNAVIGAIVPTKDMSSTPYHNRVYL